jgi:O-glycosyl hydrolase
MRMQITRALGAVAVAGALTGLAPAATGTAAATPASATGITVDGLRRGPVFDGIGAISGGGGTARLLIDYPPAQRTQILNYLFGPGGAALQLLKLEIGGDSASSDGAEPSVEHSRGQIDCQSGYGWWLAEQAVARDPKIKLLGLQWSAPGWVGSIWDKDDIGYVIDWLNCAKSHGLTISYLGGWNEHGYRIAWYTELRQALNAGGFRSVQILAADSFPGGTYDPARTWQVANAAAAHPAFKAALGVIGSHDTCGGPTTGYHCESTPAARRLGLPLWESELGTLHGNLAAANMARSINNGFIQAGITGFLEWPLTASEPAGLLYTDRGLVIAGQPQSGFYYVDRISWAIAQTTQFVQPGWRHVTGASGDIGNSGTYDTYESPDRRDWSLVAQDAGNLPGQYVRPQTITVHLTGGLKAGPVSVWSTSLLSSKPARWFVHRPSIHPKAGTFSYTIQPGYVVSFTSTTGQSHLKYTAPAAAPMHLPYTATPDASNEAWGLGTQEGAFVYAPCLGGAAGQCIEQLAAQPPVFWQTPRFGTPAPYAVIGATGWASYTVSANVLLTTAAGSAGLIGRFSHQGNDPKHFDGYELSLTGDGSWQLVANNSRAIAQVLASGTVPGIQPGTWHAIALGLSGSRITALVDGHSVAAVTSSAYPSGLAGIASNWAPVQFSGLTIGS